MHIRNLFIAALLALGTASPALAQAPAAGNRAAAGGGCAKPPQQWDSTGPEVDCCGRRFGPDRRTHGLPISLVPSQASG